MCGSVLSFFFLLWNSWKKISAFGLGAALGGPVGGWAHDNLGWYGSSIVVEGWITRAFFLTGDGLFISRLEEFKIWNQWPPCSISSHFFQAPLIIFSLLVVATKVNIQLSDEIQHQKLSDKLRRIDYFGAITLAGALGCFFVAIDFGATDEMQWTDPLVVFLFASSAFLAFSFVMTEKYWAPYPVLPLQLILRRVPLAISLSLFLLSTSVFSMVSRISSAVSSFILTGSMW